MSSHGGDLKKFTGCDICIKISKARHICRSHATNDHICHICKIKGHAPWFHCGLCKSTNHSTKQHKFMCKHCKTFDHVTNKHPCNRCGGLGHSSKIHCDFCLENHKTEDHLCLYCFKKGHDHKSHNCVHCPEPHKTPDHLCRLCGKKGHGEIHEIKEIDYHNTINSVMLSMVSNMPISLIPLIINYSGNGNPHQTCKKCNKLYHQDFPHYAHCYSCRRCGHETTVFGNCQGLSIN